MSCQTYYCIHHSVARGPKKFTCGLSSLKSFGFDRNPALPGPVCCALNCSSKLSDWRTSCDTRGISGAAVGRNWFAAGWNWLKEAGLWQNEVGPGPVPSAACVAGLVFRITPNCWFWNQREIMMGACCQSFPIPKSRDRIPSLWLSHP